MGRVAKARRSAQKMRAKRTAKAARRTAYAAMRGSSKKSKKLLARGKTGPTAGKHRHLVEHCGNVGCVRCYPEFALVVVGNRRILRVVAERMYGYGELN